MKVVTAEFRHRTRVVTVLEDSVDEVEWINQWLKDQQHDPGNQPHLIYVTPVEGFGTTELRLGVMGYLVNYETTWNGEVKL